MPPSSAACAAWCSGLSPDASPGLPQGGGILIRAALTAPLEIPQVMPPALHAVHFPILTVTAQVHTTIRGTGIIQDQQRTLKKRRGAWRRAPCAHTSIPRFQAVTACRRTTSSGGRIGSGSSLPAVLNAQHGPLSPHCWHSIRNSPPLRTAIPTSTSGCAPQRRHGFILISSMRSPPDSITQTGTSVPFFFCLFFLLCLFLCLGMFRIHTRARARACAR